MQFTVGSRAVILPTIFTRYAHLEVTIRHVLPHRTGKETLEKYEVELPDGRRQTFWGIQLGPDKQDIQPDARR